MILVATLALLISSAQAQNNAPGQVRMQIPLGGTQPAPAPGAQPGRPGAPAGQPAAGAATGTQLTLPAGSLPVVNAPIPSIFTDTGMDALLTEDFIRSLRDPFSPPVAVTRREAPKTELETIQLRELHLNGIITGPRKVRAMLSGPGAKTYFVAVGDKIGIRQGRVTSIQPDLIKVVEYDVDDRGRKVPEVFEVRISGEIVSLSKKDE